MAADKLTDKQQRFCEEYLIDLNATQAAIRAGYAGNSAMEQGYQLLQKTSVHARIVELKAARAEKLNIDAEWVLKRLVAISDRAMQAEAVMKFNYDTKQMEETGEYQFDSSGANKATELIGKHIGFFEKDNEQGKATPIFKTEVKIIPSPVPLAFNEKDIEE